MVRVLIIDDHAHVRAAISLALQAKGYETVGANSGATGVREFDHSKFDLAIIDIYMPGIDGVKVIKMLRQRAADLPIVAISGVPLKHTTRTALDFFPMVPGLSNVVCLTKPFRPTELLQAIQQALGTRAGRGRDWVASKHEYP